MFLYKLNTYNFISDFHPLELQAGENLNYWISRFIHLLHPAPFQDSNDKNMLSFEMLNSIIRFLSTV